MYRICSIIFSCIYIVSAAACVSGHVVPKANSPAPENTVQAASIQNTADADEVRAAARLLPELARAAGTYDTEKAFTLFAAIKAACADNADNATLTAARERIRPLLAAVSIEPLSQPAPVIAGTPFSEPFSARFTITLPEKQIILSSAPVLVSYPSGKEEADSPAMHTEQVLTNSDGVLHFTPPPPEKALIGTLSFYIYPEEAAGVFSSAPDHLRTDFSYRVITAEKKIPTIIAILDYDEQNQPVFSDNVTATRVLAGLMKRGFSRVGLDEYRELAAATEMPLITAAQEKIGSSIERFVFGKTHITVNQNEGGTFTCVIHGDISIWSFKQARKINRFTVEYSAEAATKKQAIQSARTHLGDTLISERLQYGF